MLPLRTCLTARGSASPRGICADFTARPKAAASRGLSPYRLMHADRISLLNFFIRNIIPNPRQPRRASVDCETAAGFHDLIDYRLAFSGAKTGFMGKAA